MEQWFRALVKYGPPVQLSCKAEDQHCKELYIDHTRCPSLNLVLVQNWESIPKTDQPTLRHMVGSQIIMNSVHTIPKCVFSLPFEDAFTILGTCFQVKQFVSMYLDSNACILCCVEAGTEWF